MNTTGEIYTVTVLTINQDNETNEYRKDCTFADALGIIEEAENVAQLAGLDYYSDYDCWQRILPDGSSQLIRIDLTTFSGEPVPREDREKYQWWTNPRLTRQYVTETT
jgi:hypothetical protein